MAKRRINWKNVRKVGAVGLAALTVFSTLTFGGNVVERGSGTVKAAGAVPSIQDASSAVNYSTILGRATDFGILADKFQQINHMQTTYAVNVFANKNGDNTQIDLIPQNSTAQILIGSKDPDPSRTIENPFVFGSTANGVTINLEAPQDVLVERRKIYR